MVHKIPPKPSILDDFEYIKMCAGRKLYREGKRYYTWDSLHGEVEVFDSRGYHLGSIDPLNGIYLKGPVKGRRIDV